MRSQSFEVDLNHTSHVALVRLCDPPESFVGTPHEDGFGRGPTSSRCRKDRAAKAAGHHVSTSDARVLLTVRFQARIALIGLCHLTVA